MSQDIVKMIVKFSFMLDVFIKSKIAQKTVVLRPEYTLYFQKIPQKKLEILLILSSLKRFEKQFPRKAIFSFLLQLNGFNFRLKQYERS